MAKNPKPAHRTLPEVLKSPYEVEWLRGPVSLKDGFIVMDPVKAERYRPLRNPTIGIRLARVRTQADALAFAREFGLLFSGDVTLPAEYLKTLPAEARIEKDKAQDFIDAGAKLRRITETVFFVRERVAKGVESEELIDLEAVIEEVLAELSWGLDRATPRIYDRAAMGEPGARLGQIRVGLVPGTLKAVCYLQTAYFLMDATSLRECERCKVIFEPHDGRQRFCTPLCGTLARIERKRLRDDSRTKAKTPRARRR